MNSSQPTTATEQPIGIVQSSYTVSITFSARPDDELRRKLKAAGFLFDRGRWYRNQSDSNNAARAMVEQLLG